MAFVMGIAGGSASGKSTLLRAFKQRLAEKVAVLSLDDYYKPIHLQEQDHNGVVNFDLPGAIDQPRFEDDLQKLLSHQELQLDEYHFNNPFKKKKKLKTVTPAPVVLVEGLFVFYFSHIQKVMHFGVFVHADPHIRYQRRLKRDMQERGIAESTVQYQWQHHVEPAYQQYLEPFKSTADVVINNNDSHEHAVDMMCAYLENKAI